MEKKEHIYITEWGEVVYELLYELPLSLSPSEHVINDSPLVESRCSCSMTSRGPHFIHPYGEQDLLTPNVGR